MALLKIKLRNSAPSNLIDRNFNFQHGLDATTTFAPAIPIVSL
jgi:hypothetical protein